MGWLVNSALASLALAFIAVKLFDYLFAGASSGLASIARGVIFISTWTAVTAQAGMHGFTKEVRNLRLSLLKHLH